jgi:predicted DNA-binding transcriptional regulator AlpA
MYAGNENQNQIKEEGLLRLPEVLKRFPVSRSTWWPE